MMKNKFQNEILMYLIFGVLTTLINFLIYWILVLINIEYKLSNIIAFIISVIFAYITNKLFVFNSKNYKTKIIFKEFIEFFCFRIITFIIEMFCLIMFVDLFNFNNLFSKIITNIVVIILNYIISKFYVFKKMKEN